MNRGWINEPVYETRSLFPTLICFCRDFFWDICSGVNFLAIVQWDNGVQKTENRYPKQWKSAIWTLSRDRAFFVVRLLKLSGRFVIQSTMRPSCIVKNDVLGNSFSERCFRPIFPPIKLLTLHGGEKGFNYCIVVRLTRSGQWLNHGVFIQLGYKRFGAVGCSSVGMKDQPRSWISWGTGFTECSPQ